MSWELLKPKASDPNDVPSDVRQHLKCVIIDPKSVRLSHQKSKLLWHLYSMNTPNGKQNSHNADDTPQAHAQTQGHRLAKQLHPRVQNSLNSTELREVNQYLYENIGFQQIHDAFNEEFLQKYTDICTY